MHLHNKHANATGELPVMIVGTFDSNRASIVDYDGGSTVGYLENKLLILRGRVLERQKNRTYERVRLDTAPSARVCHM